jgi:DNA (cytosine-5)-methyltransferase 1
MTKYNTWNINAPIRLLVGGTPCQSFSVAGLRKGLKDPRGNLALTFLGMVDHFRPEWLVWENVPGVLSDKGNAFGQFLWGLEKLGYEWAYRVLDAQYFGVPQRRRRVFVVASPRGSGVHPAEILFEPESLCRDLTPSQSERERVAAYSIQGTAIGRQPENGPQHGDVIKDGTSHTLTRRDIHAVGVPSVCPTLRSGGNQTGGDRPPGTDVDTADSLIPTTAHTLMAKHDASEDGTGRGIPLVANCLTRRMHKGINTTLGEGQTPIPVAFETRFARNGRGKPASVVPPLKAQSGQTGKGDAATCIQIGMAVRRLTPVECERLQGFPDNFTRIPWRGKDPEYCPDGPRYKALGNSMAVPVMRWIGDRIEEKRKKDYKKS